MINAQSYTFDVPANGSFRLLCNGSYFKIVTALGLLDLKGDAFDFKDALPGDGLSNARFSYITIVDKSGAVNSVRLIVSDSEFVNAPTVNTSILANKTTISANFANTQKTVTTASAQLVAGNAARQYLMVQNKDPAGSIWLNFGAGAATQANGLRIGPGGAWEWDSTVSNQAVQAIGDAASNANIVVVEG